MRKRIIYSISLFLIPLLFICDILFGSVSIPWQAFVDAFMGRGSGTIWNDIIYTMRLPRAIAALLAGIALPISGLLMQTLFRNPLADPYILGVSAGASLGVAVFSLAGGLFLGTIPAILGGIGIALSALMGASIVLFVILAIAPRVKDTVSLLIIGIMFGSITSAIVTMLQYFSNPDEVHAFLLWTMGSFSNIDMNSLLIMAFCIIPILFATVAIHKSLDALLLGDNYARSLGVNVYRLRFLVILISSILAGVVTAFSGPIGFVGLIVPHIARFLLKTSLHKYLIAGSLCIGVSLMLLCDLLSQMPGFQTVLPINTVTAIFGAPVVIGILCKRSW